MGLLFGLQPDLRKSRDQCFVLESAKKRLFMAGTLLFGAAILASMFLAAAPLFKLLWEEGSGFDKIVTGFIYGSLFSYPLVAMGFIFYNEELRVKKTSGGFEFFKKKSLLGIPLLKQSLGPASLKDLRIGNWKGSRNVATFKSIEEPQMARYATRGHWILWLHKGNEKLLLERRARLEDIELLKAQIECFFDAGTESQKANTEEPKEENSHESTL